MAHGWNTSGFGIAQIFDLDRHNAPCRHRQPIAGRMTAKVDERVDLILPQPLRKCIVC